MLKKLTKFLCCAGCVSYVGIGSTIIYCGAKICKWGLTELENDINKKIDKLPKFDANIAENIS